MNPTSIVSIYRNTLASIARDLSNTGRDLIALTLIRGGFAVATAGMRRSLGLIDMQSIPMVPEPESEPKHPQSDAVVHTETFEKGDLQGYPFDQAEPEEGFDVPVIPDRPELRARVGFDIREG